MNIIYGIGKIKKKIQRPILVIGVFDGVHLGHRYLIQRAVQRARRMKGTVVVMTFFPHPVHVLKPQKYYPFLISLEHRLRLIAACDVDFCLVVNFTKKFSCLTPRQFVEKYIIQPVQPKEIFIGDDFRFGKARSGDTGMLKKYAQAFHVKVHVVSSLKRNHQVVSSTRIRKYITSGKIHAAACLLGRPVSLLETVRKGKGRGKRLGFPTANIDPFREVIPPSGVYMVEVQLGKEIYRGMANIGVRPSFVQKDKRIIVEVHLFHFRGNIYNKTIEVKFLKRIRREKEFLTKEKLIDQLTKDKRKITGMFPKI